jgi:type IV pilus assembly protein PilC
LTSRLIRNTVNRATQQVREGQSLHSGLASNSVIPVLALDMIEVGESSGALAPMLNSVAEFYEDEVALRLQGMVSVIEPVILLFMAAVVLFILVSLYLPVFSVSVGGGGS